MNAVVEPYRLTAGARRLTCIHEAAHAVMAALGGSNIYRLAVAPCGATEWAVLSSKGPHVLNGLWGVCQATDAWLLYMFLDWDEGSGCYRLNNASLASMGAFGFKSMRSTARAEICMLLAGIAAEAIYLGDKPSLYSDCSFDRAEDLAKAEGLALLLHWRHEYDFLVMLVEQVLLREDVWAVVMRLADELGLQGDMSEFNGLLPLAIDSGHWPPSPRSKAALNASNFKLQVEDRVQRRPNL